MPTTTPLTDAINALTRYANETTGAGDTNLSDAVATLVAGYGGGSSAPELIYNWDFTQSLTDTVAGVTATLSGTNATRDSTGVHFAAANNYLYLGRNISVNGVTVEVDISNMSYSNSGSNGRLLMYDRNSGKGLVYRWATRRWGIYTSTWQDFSSYTDQNYFSGHTLKVVFDKYQYPSFYLDNTFMFTGNAPWPYVTDLGSTGTAFFNMDITGLRIYIGDTTQS